MKVKDFSVSKEEFNLVYHTELDLYATQPQPSLENIPKYYQSDNYISHTDATQTTFDKLYQAIKRINLSSKYKLITKYKHLDQDSICLDIGCGTGDFMKYLSQHNLQVRGVEPNEKARLLAHKKFDNSEIIHSDLDGLVQHQNYQFDIITLWHVLEHLPDYDSYLKKIKNILKPDGLLLIAVPNYKSYDAKYYKEFWAAYDVPRHLWHFSRKSITQIIEPHQLKVLATQPMYFDAYYVSLLSEQYKNGKKNGLKAFLIGTLSNLKAIFTREYSSVIYVIKKTD